MPTRTYSKLPDGPGCYLVTTSSGTRYVFNRAEFTVTRIPTPDASPSVNDGVRRIRTVESCTIGEAGFWTIRSNDPDVDWYWQQTTPVVSIVEISAGRTSAEVDVSVGQRGWRVDDA